MYIEPNTVIKFYKNVPLNNTYKHTLFFNNIAEQNNYFHANPSILITTLTNQSYQRHSKGSMRVQLRAESLYNCNYIAFQNASFGSKWFYGFVTNVEYVNNEVCAVSYEIDEIQSWLLYLTIGDCFVEREHTRNDNFGYNLKEEPFTINDYVDNNVYKHYYTNMLCAIQWTPPNTDSNHVTLSNGNVTGLRTSVPTHFTEEDINDEINRIINTEHGEVVALYLVPTNYIGSARYEDVDLGLPYYGGYLDGYIPKNNKMYYYPFNKLTVYSSDGNEKDFAFEYMNYLGAPLPPPVVSNITFREYHNITNKCEGVSVPVYYKGGLEFDIENGVWCTNFPICSWRDNEYQNYIARNNTADNINRLLKIGNNMSTALAYGSPVMGITGSINAVESALTKVNEMTKLKNLPSDIKGNSQGGNLLSEIRQIGFKYTRKTINHDLAKSIDTFFTMYGYAVNEVKKPNVFDGGTKRKEWDYIKCKTVTIKGEAPADTISKISDILNNGITFWYNAENFGNYEIDNSVRS